MSIDKKFQTEEFKVFLARLNQNEQAKKFQLDVLHRELKDVTERQEETEFEYNSIVRTRALFDEVVRLDELRDNVLAENEHLEHEKTELINAVEGFIKLIQNITKELVFNNGFSNEYQNAKLCAAKALDIITDSKPFIEKAMKLKESSICDDSIGFDGKIQDLSL